MKFIKENFHDIVRLLLNQIALAVFGLVLVSAARMSNDGVIGVLALVASILSILFYMYILYATMQEIGAKHRIRVEGGRMKRDTFWGLKIMTVSQIPNFICIFLLIIGLILAFTSGAADAGKAIHGVTQMILYFLQATYNGVIGYFTGDTTGVTDPAVLNVAMIKVTVGYLLSVIPGLLVCWGSYVMGLHDKKLSNLFTAKPAQQKIEEKKEEKTDKQDEEQS